MITFADRYVRNGRLRLALLALVGWTATRSWAVEDGALRIEPPDEAAVLTNVQVEALPGDVVRPTEKTPSASEANEPEGQAVEQSSLSAKLVSFSSDLTAWQALGKVFEQIPQQPNYTLVSTALLAEVQVRAVAMGVSNMIWPRALEEVLKPFELSFLEDDGVLKIGDKVQLADLRCAIAQEQLDRNQTKIKAAFSGGTRLMDALGFIRREARVKLQFDYMEAADRTDITDVQEGAAVTNGITNVKRTTYTTPDASGSEWREILAQVLDPHDYGYVEECGVVKVMKKSKITTHKEAQLKAQPLASRLIRVFHTDPKTLAERMEKSKKTLLLHPDASIMLIGGWDDQSKTYPGAAGGKVESVAPGKTAGGETPGFANYKAMRRPQTPPSVLIQDVESNLDAVEALIRSLDKRERQVLIEARILDLGKDANKKLGFVLNTFGGAYSGRIAGEYLGGARNGLLWTRTAILNPLQMDATWSALQGEKDAKVVSQPVVVVGDHAEAVIRVATIEPILQLTTEYIDNSDNTAESYEWITLSIGITLWVVPEISADGRSIRLSVHPQITEKTADSVSAPDGSKYPVLDSREIDTRVTVPTGNTLLMGGLLKASGGVKEQRVPLLGRIPLLGRLFRYNETDNKRSNLIMLITPTILDDENPDTRYEQRSDSVMDAALQGLGPDLDTNQLYKAERNLERIYPKKR